MKFAPLICAFLLLASAPLADARRLYTTLKTEPVGQARMTWALLDLYDATLYAPNRRYNPAQPYVLELTYLRKLNPNRVAGVAAEEMQRLGLADTAALTTWQKQMAEWFGSISSGTKLAAIRNADGSTSFIKNGTTYLGTIADPRFGTYFFGIWLSPQSQRPDLARQLKGADA